MKSRKSWFYFLYQCTQSSPTRYKNGLDAGLYTSPINVSLWFRNKHPFLEREKETLAHWLSPGDLDIHQVLASWIRHFFSDHQETQNIQTSNSVPDIYLVTLDAFWFKHFMAKEALRSSYASPHTCNCIWHLI